MSLTEILAVIRASGQHRASEIEAQIKAQQDAMLADAEAKAIIVRKEARRMAVQPALNQRAALIYDAQIEALRIIAESRESILNIILNGIHDKLVQIRFEEDYPVLLKGLFLEAVHEFSEIENLEKKATIRANPLDRAYLEGYLDELDLDVTIQYDLNSWGGVIIRSDDDRITIDNSLESRFERAVPLVRRSLTLQLEEIVSEQRAKPKPSEPFDR